MCKSYNQSETQFTYCFTCGEKFSFILDIYHSFISGGEERADKWEYHHTSHLGSTPCPNCGSFQNHQIELDDLKHAKIKMFSQRQVFELYLKEKRELNISLIKDEIKGVEDVIQHSKLEIEKENVRRDFLICKRDSIIDNIYFKEELNDLNKKISNSLEHTANHNSFLIKNTGKLTSLFKKKIEIYLDK